ncbi:MAG: tRNA (guanosine(37)-N1)-methyltransferase TrmD [Candidatus Bipolaricaulia bacterium]
MVEPTDRSIRTVRLRIDILTLFPEMLIGFFSMGGLARAQQCGLIEIHLHHLREFATGKHRQVDDRPYGGGPGMVLKAEPFFRGVEHIKDQVPGTPRVILFTSRGRRFNQTLAKELAQEGHLILLCGRYQGVDERVTQIVTDEISIGDFVLSGGEAATAAVVEATARLIPGVVGNCESVTRDSFYAESMLGPPQYTRPQHFRDYEVPEVLLSGDHARIEAFRREKAREKTRRNRPDLLE